MQKKLFKYTFEILLKIRFKFTILKYRLLILFSQKKFKFDDITKINSPLILISQIQRSGGTLLAQLFDGSDQVYAYPTELQVTRPKWALEKEKNFNILHQEYFHRIAKTKRFSKPGKATWEESYPFDIDLILQKKIFDKLPKKSSREDFDAYFTSFFASFRNYKNTDKSKKKFISAFIPRVNMHDRGLNAFFDFYPDGYLLSIVRHPLSWLASAMKHDRTFSNYNEALATWAISTERSLKSSKGNNRVLIINFEELIINTKKTMNHLCSYLNIDQEEIFYHPTFNKEKVLSDSSFKANKGVDKNVLDRTKYLDKALLNKLQVNHCEDLYAESLIESINISSS